MVTCSKYSREFPRGCGGVRVSMKVLSSRHVIFAVVLGGLPLLKASNSCLRWSCVGGGLKRRTHSFSCLGGGLKLCNNPLCLGGGLKRRTFNIAGYHRLWGQAGPSTSDLKYILNQPNKIWTSRLKSNIKIIQDHLSNKQDHILIQSNISKTNIEIQE